MSDGLLIRHTDSEGLIRSVGEPPHGIVIIRVVHGEVSWTINSEVMPDRPLGPDGTRTDIRTLDIENEGQMGVAVTAAELVDALESGREALAIVDALNVSLDNAVKYARPTLGYELLRNMAELAVETRNALIERGFIQTELGGKG